MDLELEIKTVAKLQDEIDQELLNDEALSIEELKEIAEKRIVNEIKK